MPGYARNARPISTSFASLRYDLGRLARNRRARGGVLSLAVLRRLGGAVSCFGPLSAVGGPRLDPPDDGTDEFDEAAHKLRGIALMREAIDLPFTEDRAAWDAWCKGWAKRAETWINETKL